MIESYPNRRGRGHALLPRRGEAQTPSDTRRPDRVAERIREEGATFLAEDAEGPAYRKGWFDELPAPK